MSEDYYVLLEYKYKDPSQISPEGTLHDPLRNSTDRGSGKELLPPE